MKLKEYIKNGHIITATDKAYNVIYRKQGYVPYETKKVENIANSTKNDDNNTSKGNKNLSKQDLINLCKEKGIPVGEKDTVAIWKEKLETFEGDNNNE